MNFDIFCNRLKQLRIENNLTLSQLGECIGSKKATISNLENGNKKPSLEFIVTIAKYFNVSLDYLTGRTNSPDIIINNVEQNISKEEFELLEDFRLLNKYEQNIILGKISEMIYNKNIENNSLKAAEEPVEYKDRLRK